jgi:hypothetical protein
VGSVCYTLAEVLMPLTPDFESFLVRDGAISLKLPVDGTRTQYFRYSSWPEELAWTDSFLSEYIDAWRHFHPEASDGFTCWNQKKSARLFNEGAR